MAYRIFVLIWIIFCQNTLAQDPYYINYSINDGLPTSTIYSVNQDKNGYLWFTTDSGIIKYDSHRFELFNTDSGLSDNEVFQMVTDFKGRTWLLTLTGKLSFIYKNKIYNESNSSLIKKASGSSITADLYQDKLNTIYISYRNGEIVIIKPNNEVIRKKSSGLSLNGLWKENDSVFTIHKEISNFATKKKIKKISISPFLKIYHSELGNYLSDKNILYKIYNSNKFDKIAEIPIQYEIINSYIENKNKIWICTRNGLFLVVDNTVKQLYFKDFAVTSIVKDFEEGYWVSTLNNGIIYIPSFDFYINKLSEDKSAKPNCISINNKEIWVGGFNNDYYVKKNTGSFEQKEFIVGKRKDKINNIRFNNKETYIIGKTAIKKIGLNRKETILGFSANDMLINDEETFIGYTYTYSIPNSKIESKIDSRFKPKLFIDKRTNIFAKGDNNDLWIGTNFGLYQYSKKDSIIYWGKNNDKLQTSIEDLYYDETSKIVFVATASKGIVGIQNNKIKFQINKGLNSNICNSIKKITATYYLIGTNNGLNSLVYKNNKFEVKNLNAIFGLKNSKVNDIDFLDNIVYLATDKGLLSFNIKNITTTKNRPKCHIINLKNQNKIIEENFVFPYNKSDVSINFNGISYLNQGNLTYYYKLNEQNNEWTSSKEFQINYKLLPPKKYTFCVYAIDGFGIKSNIETIQFEILPPFWQRLWFIILSVIILTSLLYLFIKYRLKKIQNQFDQEKFIIQNERDKANLEKQMIELEQKALRMQMNPHFIFNALNTIKGYYSEGNDEKAGNYISKFSTLLRMLLENTEQTIPLATEIKMLNLYIDLTKIRYKNAFQYSIEIDTNIISEEVAIPTLLLQPIVENAIIHGLSPKKTNGILQISFYKKGNYLECIVKDNGIGRKAAAEKQKHKQHESKAIEITKDRIQFLENNKTSKSSFSIEDVYDSNNSGIGTVVTILIPFKTIW